jgi:hypothetical protein
MLLLSTAYFPPVEYFVYLVYSGKAVIDLNETYCKQTWRNRCTLMSGNGPCNLVVPVEKPMGNHTPTREIIISNHSGWQQNHWKTITSAYRSAPFFMYYADLIRDILLEEKKTEKLYELNHKILHDICRETGLKIETGMAENFIPLSDNPFDLRFAITPKTSGSNAKRQLKLKPWYQVFEDRFGFCPGVSILDLVFNMGPDTAAYLEEMSEQIEI